MPTNASTPTGFFLVLALGIALVAGSYVTGLWKGPSLADLPRPVLPSQEAAPSRHEGEPRRPLELGAGSGPVAASIAAPSGRWARHVETPAAPAIRGDFRVVKTNGEGVYIRRTPRLTDRVVAWPENTAMANLGEVVASEGIDWTRVRDPSGNVGWIPTHYLGTW
jgi:hypothetical protein